MNKDTKERKRDKKKVAVITARSGSKGLKDKNILDICGKPMIAYSIEAAITSNLFEQVIVSTDSERYGRISKKYGAEVMYRGNELSNDRATTYMVLEDVLHRLAQAGREYDYFALLQPTSPLRTARHVIEASALFESKMEDFDFLVSVKEAEHAGVLVRPIDEDGSLKYFDTDFSNYRRQGFTDYSPNGALFLGKPDVYLENQHFFGARSLAYKMSRMDSIDVDGRLDYEFACLCMEKRLRGEEL